MDAGRANSVPLRAVATFRYALRGIGFMFGALNVRVLAAATLLTIGAGLYFSISAVEWCVVILATALVWAAEGLNTALERLTDLVSPQHHPLAGRAKDIAAGAVLLAAIGALCVGLVVFLPRVV
ncbi:MAG TPA: diacylglycerol kinase family protein [Burkholderiales bacterium]|nr:diacylglycerol kinase family protein [Burkholderiales bacterium]